MDLLKHNDFSFKNILQGGYKILPNKPDVISKVTMANGSVRKNYGRMPKTTVKITFGQLDRDTYREYMSHFSLPEDYYSYYDTDTGEMKTKKFSVERENDSIDYIDDIKERHEEFTVTLTQVDELEVQDDNS